MRPLLALLLLVAVSARAEDGTQAGRFIVERPTLENLGFEWAITGDADRDASVSVEFRRAGERDWRSALPLLRIGGERVFRSRQHLDYTVPDGFAGSILDLEPSSEYECRFRLTDPDGVTGQATHTVRVTTRREPRPYESGRTLHVYPPDHEGARIEPHFTSLLQAYYGAGLGDWSVVWERRAQPHPSPSPRSRPRRPLSPTERRPGADIVPGQSCWRAPSPWTSSAVPPARDA